VEYLLAHGYREISLYVRRLDESEWHAQQSTVFGLGAVSEQYFSVNEFAFREQRRIGTDFHSTSWNKKLVTAT
jgi:hypothetical protein